MTEQHDFRQILIAAYRRYLGREPDDAAMHF